MQFKLYNDEVIVGNRLKINVLLIIGILLISTLAYSVIEGEYVSQSKNPHLKAIDQFVYRIIGLHPALFCTITKIGPRHYLTATHCVDNKFLKKSENSPIYINQTGYTQKKVALFREIYPQYSYVYKNEIDHIWIHPSYWEDQLNYKDIAVIVLKKIKNSTLINRPSATISLDKPSLNQNIFLNGYGTHEIDITLKEYINFKLFNDQDIEMKFLLKQRGLKGYINKISYFDDHIYTVENEHHTSLAQGDSGGSVFQLVNNELKIIGVNTSAAKPEALISFNNLSCTFKENQFSSFFSINQDHRDSWIYHVLKSERIIKD